MYPCNDSKFLYIILYYIKYLGKRKKVNENKKQYLLSTRFTVKNAFISLLFHIDCIPKSRI